MRCVNSNTGGDTVVLSLIFYFLNHVVMSLIRISPPLPHFEASTYVEAFSFLSINDEF